MASSQSETPAEAIIRRLTEERIEELKEEIRKQQEEYAKLYNELKSLKMNKYSDKELLIMWRDMQREEETQRIEEMKRENKIREREQRMQEVQRNWLSAGQGATVANAVQTPAKNNAFDVNMDVEEIIGTGKPILKMVDVMSSQQQQTPQTSPLLSSLLKTPAATTTSAVTLTPAISVSAGTSARATAPTITTLLTSGSIPNTNQPAITLKSSIPCNDAAHILTRPISGPPVDSIANVTTSTQNLLSPSQSAPTLSMLLEKNKSLVAYNDSQDATKSKISEIKESSVTENTDIVRTNDSNNEEVDMDIEEDASVRVCTSNTDVNNEFDEPDPNEEQQLLEVFKNIGNIDECLDIDVATVIDEEVDFLKGVDEDAPNESADAMDFETKLEAEVITKVSQQTTEADRSEEQTKTEVKNNLETENGNADETPIKENEDKQKETTKVETISSDDSNDNIPLAAVATMESKDRSHYAEDSQGSVFIRENDDSETKTENDAKYVNDNTITTLETDDNNEYKEHSVVGAIDTETDTALDLNDTKNHNVVRKSPIESDNSDVIIIPTDDEDSNGAIESEQPQKMETPSLLTEEEHFKVEPEIDNKETTVMISDSNLSSIKASNEESTSALTREAATSECELKTDAPPSTISIADTDEDSSTTDVSITTRRDDKISTSGKVSAQQQAKFLHESMRNEQKTDDESITLTSSATPVRPPALRKLRERDRSESPMVEEETASDHSMSQRYRHVYSSTPNIDSIPNSPASSDRDDRDTKSSKKSLMKIFNSIHPNKNITVFQRAFNEDHKYQEICLRFVDFQTIKKNIESGTIRSVAELQRDIMLMCQNALMLLKISSSNYKAVSSFMRECLIIINNFEKEAKEIKASSGSHNTSSVKIRGSSRKSQRIT